MTPVSPTTFELASLQDLSVTELKALWRVHVRRSMPEHLPKFLLSRLLAYKLQVARAGDLSKSTTRYLDQIANDLEAGREPTVPYLAEQRIKSGSVIVREHGGIQHRVMVTDAGFAWNGNTYGSLSAVAKAITGTSWNGLRFFGLMEKRRSNGEVAA